MGDRMMPLPFADLMDWALREYRARGSLFGVEAAYRGTARRYRLPDAAVETPFGPAAGPHTQLAQNIVAAYAGGARFFELKTVQTLDGEDLHVEKPCIRALHEGYNVEWSTELTVPQAMDEYIKAWYALSLLSASLGLGTPDGFAFNASVGYDLQGIASPKIDAFIEGLKDARHTEIWRTCEGWARANASSLGLDDAFLRAIDPHIVRSVTLSTLHGCPAGEIERIAAYLLTQKRLHTYVKCNPTLLGYDFARETLDRLGYADLSFDDHHFKEDLQYQDAVPMLQRLMECASALGLRFGVKLTNTFPVDIARGELPGSEMYMSGCALYPLSIHLAAKLARDFAGKLPISYSGGADAGNIRAIYDAGVMPITMATTLLQPGGYARLTAISALFADAPIAPAIDPDRLDALARAALTDPHYRHREARRDVSKIQGKPPLLHCFTAPCASACPIHQDIPAYMAHAAAGEYEDALRVILQRNPLPSITGTICPHCCEGACARQYCDAPLRVRDCKLRCATAGHADVLKTLHPEGKSDARVAIVGGGPCGMAAAFLLAREGATVTIFEQQAKLGGVVRYAIPDFRIPDQAIDADAALLRALGVTVKLGEAVADPRALLHQGYTHVLLAVGAQAEAKLPLEGDPAMDAVTFLERAKADAHLCAGKHVVVVGGGNTAMDCARAAKRLPGAETATLLYRRTRREMPADAEELSLARADGVAFCDLAAPLRWAEGRLTCVVMRLGEADASGRARPIPTGDTFELPCDALLCATGRRVDADFMQACGVPIGERGLPAPHTDRLFVAGDALTGPATVVEAIAGATRAAEAILGHALDLATPPMPGAGCGAMRGALLAPAEDAAQDGARCMHCGSICGLCAEVCPNRANVRVAVGDTSQIVHLDALCNECGNCRAFCPYDGAPYRDKFTLFSSREAFVQSENPGFLPLADGLVLTRLDGKVCEERLDDPIAPPEIIALIRAVLCG